MASSLSVQSVLVLLTLLQRGSAITCYSCKAHQVHCKEHPDKGDTCEDFFCSTIQFVLDKGRYISVARSCNSVGVADKCTKHNSVDFSANICICNSSYCNGKVERSEKSGRMAPVASMLVTGVGLILNFWIPRCI